MAEIQFTSGLDAVAGADLFSWLAVSESDTFSPILPRGTRALAGCVQAAGTFGSATVILQGSNDGANWFSISDVSGSAVSFTSAGAAEFSTSALYLRPFASGGSSQSVGVYLCLRG